VESLLFKEVLMLRSVPMCAALAASLVAWAPSPISADAAAASSAPLGTFTVPLSNVASSDPVLDGRHLVYGVAVPRFHRPVCVSCGQQPFTNFHVQVYLRDYQRRASSTTISQPRLLFDGPRGAQLGLRSISGSWLVYNTYTPQDRWQLIARNVFNGRAVLLDSPQMEGLPSRFLHASGDGRTVVWQSWTRVHRQDVSVIRSYTLATGSRRLLLSGGTGADYFWGYPQIAGNRLVLVKELGNTGTPQLFLEDLTTRHVRALTPRRQWNDEPFISGDIVVWRHGRSSHGLVVANLATGRNMALKAWSAQLPRIVAGRYVLFATEYPRPRVQTYDALTGRRRTIAAGPDSRGLRPGSAVEAGGNAALFQIIKPCGSSCPSQREFTLIRLGP
jgi:hypothetical protein